MPYQPNVHLPSPLHDDAKFTFLGEIIELCALPLPFDIIHSDIRSLIVAVGTVTEVNAEDVSFSMSVTQVLAAGLVVTLTIHTITHAFSGKLISVEDQDPIILLNNIHALNPLNNAIENATEIVNEGKYAVVAMVIGIQSTVSDPPLQLRGDIISLIIIGIVESIDRACNTFKLFNFHCLEGGSVTDGLSITANIPISNKWPFPLIHMPNANGMVTFSGILKSLSNHRAAISVDYITFLNKKARPSCRTLAKYSRANIEAQCTPRRPTLTALRMAK
ncbi:hypothetical protein EI94DRAFT_1698604 [Lactarius quietus]|nr:hypothetical protein EI94DRAFT_1698604 [Lactarius quietus]